MKNVNANHELCKSRIEEQCEKCATKALFRIPLPHSLTRYYRIILDVSGNCHPELAKGLYVKILRCAQNDNQRLSDRSIIAYLYK